ncbi:MAG: hypothetical protein ABSF37_12560 [Sedimentisphaerales bacterium]|jgi:hypothetical protein
MMKVGIIGCIAVLLFIGGCGNQNLKQWEKPWDPNSIWDGSVPEGGAIPDFFEGQPAGGEFPKSMAGIWEAEIPDVLWDIKLEPSGSILRIVHAVAGKVDISQGAVEESNPDNGSYSIFHMGPCESRYYPDARLVRVKIVVDYFIIKIPAGEIEGRMEDYFEGFASEDGNQWNTQWYSFRWIKGATPPNIKAIKAHPMPFIFIKLDPTQPRAEQVME